MVAVPEALGVNVTEQLPLTKVQLVALKLPVTPVAVKATEPAGVVAPAPLVSATVAVQVEGWLIPTEAGEHTMVVEVVLFVTVIEQLQAPQLVLDERTEYLGLWVTLFVAGIEEL